MYEGVKKMFCPYCGDELRENAKYCTHCGKQISNNMTAPSNAIQPSSASNKDLSNRNTIIVVSAMVLLTIVIVVSTRKHSNEPIGNNNVYSEEQHDFDSSYADYNYNEPNIQESQYQTSNSYNIPCNGNNDLAIEAANIFANKYGMTGKDWTLTNVDASVTGMEGTFRYSYTWAGSSYTATTTFTITDFGTYRNYQWKGDFVDLFYGN